jgi:hypothetical protein
MARKIVWVMLFVGSALYLLNPGLGVFEFIPDNIPLFGNFDESVAVLVLLRSMIELHIIGVGTIDQILNLKDGYEAKILGRKKEESAK